MGLSVVVGDIGGPYAPTSPGPPASFPMVAGSVKVFHTNLSVMLVGAANTAGGPIISSTLFTTITFIEGKLVHLGGSVTNLPGWVGGVLFPAGSPNVLVN